MEENKENLNNPENFEAQETTENVQDNLEQNEIEKEPSIEEMNESAFENFDEEIENAESEEEISNISDEKEASKELVTVRPVKFQEFEDKPPVRAIKKNLDIMQDISMHISVELGRTKSSIREVMEMESGSIVELDKIAGEQVEVYVNEKLVAKGEVIVIEDKFGVRVTSTNLAKNINNEISL